MGSQIPPVHSRQYSRLSIIRLYCWNQALSAASLAVIVLFRRSGSPGDFLANLLGLNATSQLANFASALNVTAVGIVIFSAIECGYAALTSGVWLATGLLRTILPVSAAPARFDIRAWPRLMQHPQRSTSLHGFWGKRWHGLFKRIFVHDGSKTFVSAVEAVGGGKLLSSAAGVIGAFVVSGWMHESCRTIASPIGLF